MMAPGGTLSRMVDPFTEQTASALSQLEGVEAITLGGSRGINGHPSPNADYDFALYYRDHFDVAQLRTLGWDGTISELGGWGGGIFNGGAWLHTQGRKVDVHYRDLTDLERRIAEAAQGRFAIEHLAFHLAGVPTYIVIAEVALSHVLVGNLPHPDYPTALRTSAADRWHHHATMTLEYAQTAYASRGDVIGFAGAAVRAIVEESHARLAAAGKWVTNEKRIVASAGLDHLALHLEHLASEPGLLQARADRISAALGISHADS